METTTTVRQAEHKDIPALAKALAGAFYDDPVVGFAWPDDAKRLRRAERSFAGHLDTLWGRRTVHTDPEFSAVAVWAEPDKWKFSLGATARIALTTMRTRVRTAALLAYLRTDALHPDEPHWYLEFLGTVPEKQGKGHGGKVLAPVLARADEEGVAVWTWSSNKRNLPFYHRHGFAVLDELPFARGGPSIYPIRREPRG